MPPLQRLEKIVSRDLVSVMNVTYDSAPTSTTYLMEDLPQALLRESDRIKGLMMKTVSDAPDPNEIRRFIRKCQYRLIGLNARLLTYSDADMIVAKYKSAEWRLKDIVCHYVYRCLRDLLIFLEDHFGKYMYWRAWVHKNYLSIARAEMMTTFNETQAMLGQLECSRLAELINRKFQRFLDPVPAATITYARIRYMCTLQVELLTLQETGISPRCISDLLLTLNFNSRNYFLYWSIQLRDILVQKATALEKLTLLAHEAARIRQHTFIRKLPYNPNALPLPEMMIAWIKEESDLIEKLFRLDSSSPEAVTENELEKAELGVAVATLAAAVRALVGSKAVPDDNITAVARILSRGFTTVRSGGSFSVKTFRQNYYTITDSTRKNVIDIFSKAITWLKHN